MGLDFAFYNHILLSYIFIFFVFALLNLKIRLKVRGKCFIVYCNISSIMYVHKKPFEMSFAILTFSIIFYGCLTNIIDTLIPLIV